MAISYPELRDAVAGGAVGVRCRTVLQPLGGPGDKVFPPTYGIDGDAETKYAKEKRRVPGEDGATDSVVDAVVLDSVASQANRFELALLDAIRRGDLKVPVTSVDFGRSGLPGFDKISDFEASHRIFDALLRDSYDGDALFRNSAAGRAVTKAKPRDAAGLYYHSPHTLVFGGWDSTGPRGGSGAKYERAITSEIVALDIEAGVRTSSRIDPAGIEKNAGVLYEGGNGEHWVLEKDEAAVDGKGAPKLLGAKEGGRGGEAGRPSLANHGNVRPSIDKASGGITARRIIGTTVLSFIQLRRLRFPTRPDGTAFEGERGEAELAARTALAALGLAGAALAFEEGFDLRSRCVLVSDGPVTFELVKRDGSADQFALGSADAVKLVGECADRASAAGLPWRGGERLLRPADRLVQLIRRSQDIAEVERAGQQLMFAIAIELLAGRYTAMQFNDRSQPEWPPHPARLFFAMVAAWADDDHPDLEERAALCWLEAQGPPEIHCGTGRRRAVVTSFVPVNDPTALTRDVAGSTYALVEGTRLALAEAQSTGDGTAVRRAQAALAKAHSKAVADGAKAGVLNGRETPSVASSVLQILPELRGKQGRTYPTVIPDHQVFWFAWPESQPSPDTFRALDALLARVGRLGHSSTLVSCRPSASGPPSAPTWVPGEAAVATRIRVPRAGLIDRLELGYATHRGEDPRTMAAEMLSYRQPGRAPARAPRLPLLGGDWYVLGFTGRLPAAPQALALTRAARAALLHHARDPVPEVISGHQQQPGASGPTAPLAKPHMAVIPLLNAGSPHSDGTIYGLALILPAGCPDADRLAVEDALRSWAAADRHHADEFRLQLPAGQRGGATEYTLMDLGADRGGAGPASQWPATALTSRRKTTSRGYWCRPGRRWLTVTPVALDRFPGNLSSRDPSARDRAELEAAASVARACVLAGLADNADDVAVSVGLTAPLTGLPAAPAGKHGPGQRRYPGYQTGSGVPRACVHAEIEFPEPVCGPVLIGAGRYLGYGLCLPREQRAEVDRA